MGKLFRIPIVKKLLALLTGITTATLFLELLLRVFDPLGVSFYFEVVRYLSNVIPDPDFAYITRPGYQDELQGVQVSTNSEGFRGAEFKVQKSKGQKRLLILGDSVVFGWGVEQDKIFPSLLQSMLDKDQLNVEVLAAGVCSWNTRTEYEFLKKKGLGYDPDVILIIIVDNDAVPQQGSRTEASKESLLPKSEFAKRFKLQIILSPLISAYHYIRESSFLFASYRYFIRRAEYTDYLIKLYQDIESPILKDARLALDGIIDLCNANNIKLVVFLYGQQNSSKVYEEFQKVYGTWLSERGILYHTFSDELFLPQYRNSLADPHPNSLGHQIITQDILKVLRSDSFLLGYSDLTDEKK